MAVDEQSSQDSTLIDDDLVAALGFEPVTTLEAETSNGDAASNGDLAGDVADDVDLDDGTANDGFGIDEIDDSDSDSLVGDVPVDDATVDVEERVSFFDLETSSDEMTADDVSIADDLDAVDDDETALVQDEVAESDLDLVPSISDPELDVDATAPVGLIDLDSDHVTVDDVTVDDVDTSDLGTAAVDGAAVDGAVIDLDTVDLSDDISAQGFADADVQELADADSVFADATPVLDPPAFDDSMGHPATETVDQVESGLLDLDVAAETIGTAAVATAATAPKGRRRLRARKSRRVIRHIDPWSVLTFSVLFHMVVFAALLLSSVLVWNAAIASGMVENIESFIQELGDYETFEINADVMFRAAIVIAGMLTLASSVLVVLLTVVFNLISDLVGGIRVTVIEEETVRVPIDKKRSKARNE